MSTKHLFSFKDLDAEMTGMIEKKLANRMVCDLVLSEEIANL